MEIWRIQGSKCKYGDKGVKDASIWVYTLKYKGIEVLSPELDKPEHHRDGVRHREAQDGRVGGGVEKSVGPDLNHCQYVSRQTD